MRKKDTLLFGAHMSISGGLHHAIERGESIGCTAIQIFTKNNRQWHAKPLDTKDVQLFKKTWSQSPIKSIIVHATYLINIASNKADLEHKSIIALKDELKRCDELDLPYLVLHPGSYTDAHENEALERVAHNLDIIFESIDTKTSVLLETMAGQGTSLCYSFEQIAIIIKKSKHKRKIGVCFDTCHAFAAGYDFSSKKSYDAMWKNFDDLIGIDKLHAIHINDSKTDCGSRVDRHANIGKGKIGLEAFKLLFNDKRFVHIPKVLETPYETIEDYIPNMETIYSLI